MTLGHWVPKSGINNGIGEKTKKTRAGGARHDHLSPYELMGLGVDEVATRRAMLNMIGIAVDEVGEEEARTWAPELVGMLTGAIKNGPN